MKFYSFKRFLPLLVFMFISLDLTNGESLIPSSSADFSEADNLIRNHPDELDETLNWKPPYDLKKNLPYFLSGFDDDGCPIWIVEIGKWDVRAQVQMFGFEQVQKYTRQMLITFYTSAEREQKEDWAGNNQTESGEKSRVCENLEWNSIVDMDGFANRQFLHPQTITTLLNLARVSFSLESKEPRMKKVVGINCNYFANALHTLGAPLIGSLENKLTVFGTNSDAWKPKLLKIFPKSVLPEWMGGSKDFKPLRIYG